MGESHSKPWDGRFERPTDESVERFTQSVSFDIRLYAEDIQASTAHAQMLEKCGLLTKAELEQITVGLQEIKADIEAGAFAFKPELEDVHMNIETELIDRIGEAGAKLHTARSRNDQIAVDSRLWIKNGTAEIIDALTRFQLSLLRKAEQYKKLIMPGFTHLQHAQPVLLGHVLIAYVESLERDKTRLEDCRERCDVSPLGACAIAGTTLATDPEFTARRLGFSAVFSNSIDAVSDRDFLVEFVFCLAMTASHLSRIAEDWILWTTAEFDFIDIDESFCTGSSIMPQKKNPDVLELIRGRTGRVYGDLFGLFTALKGLPLAYNRDMQEDKEALFDAFDTVRDSLNTMAKMTANTEFKVENLEAACERGYLDATSLAEYLVQRGLPFREAHRTVGKIVLNCATSRQKLSAVPVDELKAQCELIGDDVHESLGASNCVRLYRSHGSSSPKEVERQLKLWAKRLGKPTTPSGRQ